MEWSNTTIFGDDLLAEGNLKINIEIEKWELGVCSGLFFFVLYFSSSLISLNDESSY